ncbi:MULTISPECIES: CatB-related O-acetyltransferase [unclassified Pantoea]|uniref:CatB-related O-acetyltransferase n=1 Tax=unclassified Pantoea TaxID=2630326 RepID=UPI001FA94F76|nr:CatB-related O-acetyltransferase [Pantoea sp. MQR6]
MIEFSVFAKSSHLVPTAIIEHPIHCAPNSQIHGECIIGSYLFLNIGSVIYPHVTMGRYCSIARGCEIGVANHPINYLSTHSFQYHSAQFPNHPFYKNEIKRVQWREHPKTEIGSDVWVGAQSVIKAGVKIGHGAVIAANSVVTKDIPPYSIVGGSPAKEIKKRFTQVQIEQLLNLKWWGLEIKEISSLPFDNIDECIKLLKEIRNQK